MEEKRLVFTVEETARLLGISRNLAYELAAQGKLGAVRIGQRRLVVPKAALERLLEVGTQERRA